MTVNLFLKTSMIWLIIAFMAIINGIFRENVLVGMIGPNMAVPVSGITLSMIVLIVTYVSFPLFGKHHALTYFVIGLQWVLMTLLFEFIFGYYVMGKSWSDISEVFHIMRGNLFIIVLAVSLISPLLMAKVKRIL
ncbi:MULTISPECIES: hypothetical protein [Sulfurovum]|uniref:Uncharacterized protein n=1 Tax=Sulfurovum xiamenensis TaxID=3019066 RepID=A0ABT7QR74_9BACT|nr:MULTISPECIES: hypothetical protein [Sulfurovum]EIF51619.1 hypothetical protein SULAR_02098 [Sulfurovum sp. AR]MDM5263531.1 hypothetical protein [Sulfurovum xiamenensis]